MTVLTSLPGRHETVALQGRRNWSPVSVEYSLNELARSRGFAANPTCRPRRHVTLDTFHPGVWGILIGSELRMHGVAGGTTELRRLHVFNRTIGDLGTDKDVGQRGEAEKPCQSPQRSSTIERWLSQSLVDTLPAYIDPNCDECQACKKNDRKNQKNYDPNIRIADVSPNL